MRTLKFQSSLAPQIRNFIHLRQLSGTDYQSQALLLSYFDRFLAEEKLETLTITQQITDRYLISLSHLAPRGQSNRFCVVRQLCRHLLRSDPFTYVPEPLRAIASQAAHQPYIYSEMDIGALLAAAAELPPPGSLRPYTYRTLLGLLYSTGIRIGEALSLNLENFPEIIAPLHHPPRRTCQPPDSRLATYLWARVSEIAGIKIPDLRLQGATAQVSLLGKGKKHRSCPLWPETTQALQTYLRVRNPQEPAAKQLFLNANGAPAMAETRRLAVARCADQIAAIMCRKTLIGIRKERRI